MKYKSRLLKILTLILILSFSGCHSLFNKGEDEPIPEHLVDYEIVSSYSASQIQLLFSLIAKDYPMLSSFSDRVNYGINIFKIQYKTTFQGKQKIASGLVCLPSGEGTFPLLSFQNGTNTLHSEAPSKNPGAEAIQVLQSITSTGFVVVMPDYLGFGSSSGMAHPYLHKESTVQAVVDMLRSVKELAEEKEVLLNNDLYLAGYSQGGWATMQVQKAIEQDYSSEFRLKASAPGAGPYDLNFINEYILSQSSYPMPYYVAYLMNTLIEYEGMEIPLSHIFKPPYSELNLRALFDGKHTGGAINKELTTKTADLFTDNYRNNYRTDPEFDPLRQILSENSIEAWKTTTPMRIIHGTADNFVPMDVSTNIYNDFMQKGVSAQQVKLIPIPGADHSSGALVAGAIIIEWFLELTK